MDEYQRFLESKKIRVEPCGIDIAVEDMNQLLFDWQKAIVRWALHRGRAALFEDCGLGKTPQQLEWARHVCEHTSGNVLILAPLAVAQQTRREGQKFGIGVTVCRTGEDVRPGINVTNYERIHHFDASMFKGIVLDESSILKSFDGVTRKLLTDFAAEITFRLCCTATPAPNDLIEITNHSEFLNIMGGKEIIALFFKQDGNTTHAWRLKGHAREAFWKWMAEWSIAIRKPSDIGYDDGKFILPALHMHQITTKGKPSDGCLFVFEARTLEERRGARRSSMSDRVKACADLVNSSNEEWLVWCDLNAESDALTKAIAGAVEVRGSNTPEYKEEKLLGFSSGEFRVLVSKPSICGHGMNYQHCRNMVFVGLSDSYEALYQATRRCWRFGQEREVNCYIVTGEAEGAVVANIERKEKQATEMFDSIVKNMSVHELNRKAERSEMDYKRDVERGTDWEMHLGDSVEVIKDIASDSVGLSVFSPPFPGMYAYTNSSRDIGNVKSISELIEHFKFLMGEILRITKPGRSCCVHLTQEPVFKGKDGYVGLRDFRGKIISEMQDSGWIYYGEVTIDKNPQVKASRTKESTLLFKTLSQDSSNVRPALADYLLIFKKHGENDTPIQAGSHERWNNGAGWVTPEEWCEWAAPVWYRAMPDDGRFENYPSRHMATDGIRETDVLQVRSARESDDEKHLCPLQLGVIERAVKLWSAPGDVVFSPFAGIGSEGYQALRLFRKFIGIELKESYWKVACDNMRRGLDAREEKQVQLFSNVAE